MKTLERPIDVRVSNFSCSGLILTHWLTLLKEVELLKCVVEKALLNYKKYVSSSKKVS